MGRVQRISIEGYDIMGIVYMATNINNGKKYIGMTIRTLEERKSNHYREAKRDNKRLFYRALNKYGRDAFIWDVIAMAPNGKILKTLEREYIYIYQTTNRNVGYNITDGGEGGYSLTPEYIKEHLAGNKNPFYGHRHSMETKIAIAKGNKKRTGELHHFYGKPHPNRGKRLNINTIKCINTGDIFYSVLHASDSIGISRQSITRSLNDGLPHKGYTFVGGKDGI